jgi:hypothetical protein
MWRSDDQQWSCTRPRCDEADGAAARASRDPSARAQTIPSHRPHACMDGPPHAATTRATQLPRDSPHLYQDQPGVLYCASLVETMLHKCTTEHPASAARDESITRYTPLLCVSKGTEHNRPIRYEAAIDSRHPGEPPIHCLASSQCCEKLCSSLVTSGARSRHPDRLAVYKTTLRIGYKEDHRWLTSSRTHMSLLVLQGPGLEQKGSST